MDEEEIEQLSQLDQDYDEQDVMLTEAEEKRRIFEEKMIREHEERQRKMEAAVKQEEEREMVYIYIYIYIYWKITVFSLLFIYLFIYLFICLFVCRRYGLSL